MSPYRGSLAMMGLLAVLGCMPPAVRETVTQPEDPILARLDHGILELNENLAHLRRHITDLKSTPVPQDPLIRQLRAFDLSAWQLHEQQWQLQWEHLKFISDRIHEAQATPANKSRLRDEWIREQQGYTATLQQLRDARHKLERQRFLVESQVVQRYFE